MAQRIGNAPNGEDTVSDGTEKIPVTGSKYMLVSTIAEYIRTLSQTLTNKTLTTPTIADLTNATHNHSNNAGGGSALSSPTITTPTIADFTNATHNHSNNAGGGSALSSPTITTPTIADFTNATHNHSNNAGGGSALSSPTITTPTISGAISFPDNVTQVFNPGADNAGINVGSIAGDPATPDNGDVWYDSTANELTARINGSNVSLGAGGGNAFGTIVVSGESNVVADSANDTLTLIEGTNVTITTNATNDEITIGMTGTGGVTGPGSSTANAIARFDGTGGGAIKNTGITISDGDAITFPDDVTQTFNPGANNAGINVGSYAGDPATPDNGDIWYDSTANELTARINGSNVSLGAGGGGTSELDYVSFTSNVNPTATTEATANTVVTGNSVAYNGSTAVIIEFFANNARPASGTNNLTFWLYEDGSSIGQIGFLSSESGIQNVPVYCVRRITPSNASHTYSIRASVNTGTGLVGAGAGGSGNTAPGFIRIVKANI